VVLEAFPYTPNGKLDRAALPEPSIDRESRESNAPTTELEKQMAAIWSEVLSVPAIGIHDNFFDLGGNSLLAMRAFAKLSVVLGNTISPSILFQHGTIAELIAFTQRSQATDRVAYAIPLQAKGTGRPLFVMPQLNGELFQMRSALMGLGEEFPVIGIQIQYRRATMDYLTDLPSIARDATQAICKKDPHGPYSLVGYSYGGFLAFEVACQLVDLGKEVAHVVVIDTGPGPSGAKQKWIQRVRSIPHVFRQLPNWLRSNYPRKRLIRLANAIQRRWRRLRQYLKGRDRSPWIVDDAARDRHASDSQLDLYRTALMAIRSYEPGYFPGKLTLIRATRRPIRGDHSRDLGWLPHVQELDVLDIDGDHLNILKPPRIQRITEQLKRWMHDRNNARSDNRSTVSQ
jgi:thioesterase domain-containing protein